MTQIYIDCTSLWTIKENLEKMHLRNIYIVFNSFSWLLGLEIKMLPDITKQKYQK